MDYITLGQEKIQLALLVETTPDQDASEQEYAMYVVIRKLENVTVPLGSFL